MDTILKNLSVNLKAYSGSDITLRSPIDGQITTNLKSDTKKSLNQKIANTESAFKEWRNVPAPKRGELIRLFANELRNIKDDLGALVTLESGKVLEEGKGEVQEMIDICDFAVGLSRQIGGLTLPSERHNHRMEENWLPLGVVGVISAFNFPVAVWAWNFALAIICGNSVLWKPSEKTLLCAIACRSAFQRTVKKCDFPIPENLLEIFIGDRDVAANMLDDPRIKLISATGSTQMGRNIAPIIQQRFGRVLLELGGNNAAIITPNANLDITLPSITFGAVGTAGQRCTTTRRIIVHESLYAKIYDSLKQAYSLLEYKIGNPLDENIIIGPLIDKNSYDNMQTTLNECKQAGAEIFGGKRILTEKYPDGYYVTPAIISLKKQIDIVKHETFAPIVYLIPYTNLQEALEINNDVPQGLSSTIFTNDLREAEYFKQYSDCGIANVNISTSGAEIGGAFGGEKETGGGRESGSDSWKAYMRRQTSTIYYGADTPELAQGIKFVVG